MDGDNVIDPGITAACGVGGISLILSLPLPSLYNRVGSASRESNPNSGRQVKVMKVSLLFEHGTERRGLKS
ncbi:hypothetical protein BO83DRAFT_381588 [Aspergillus eucalypticola CBS 122712]|uniref:Uncharacterized protein n=1 Tax=Aspergillus eucalypticola (strain CBS 122712 / IBT 29274) TaxID=1448314 RepID=A0A317UXE4_ASPEC|nr:uncharacterized protein BO83DRAFT_381588 [Aspergillus eucalypticola CBS 122712]PWY65172.1 hypothetical protein BO83DRAFT_381588 [Aspergillus eucalypticola CBS 122712]